MKRHLTWQKRDITVPLLALFAVAVLVLMGQCSPPPVLPSIEPVPPSSTPTLVAPAVIETATPTPTAIESTVVLPKKTKVPPLVLAPATSTPVPSPVPTVGPSQPVELPRAGG